MKSVHLLCVLMAALVLCARANTWKDSNTGITWIYEISNGNAILGGGSSLSTAVLESATGAITIPSQLGGCPVTSIGDSAFHGCSGLTSVTIPSGVTRIGEYAFRDCSGLTSVTIPSSVVSIEWGAFYDCSGLRLVTIPEGVTNIGVFAFSGCSRLTSVTIPSSVTSMGEGAFSRTPFYNNQPDGLVIFGGVLYEYKGNCPAMVTIPDGVTSIGDHAFSGCKELVSVTIPSSVASIGCGVFFGCSGLMSIDVDSANSCYCLIDGVLYNKDATELICCPSGAKSVTIPDGVTSIRDYAFYCCSGLASVVMPESVTNIGRWAFRDCSGLTSVMIPPNVTSIGESAFSGCYELAEVHISDLALWCNIDFGDSYANPLYRAHNLYLNGEEIKDLVIPEGVTSVKDYAFEDCSGLTSVTIPSSVTSIGHSAFYDCRGLTSVTMPSSMTSIGNYAFCGCSGLTSVMIPEDVSSIGSAAFASCSGLISVTIPSSVASIGRDAFDNCGKLVTVYVESGDADRVRAMLSGKGVDVSKLTFVKMFKISFNVNGGDEECGARCIVPGEAIGELPMPTRNGYDFLGWFTSVNGGNKVSLAMIVKGNMTLYAHWERSEPGNGVKPVGGISKYDATYKYDGERHTINVGALNNVTLAEGTPLFSYSLTRDGQYQDEPIYFTNAGETSIWYKVSAPNYDDFVHEAKITILPREVALTSKDESKFYDGTPFVGSGTVDVGGDGFVDGEGVRITPTGYQLDEGESDNSFDYVFNDGTLEENYKITKQFGRLSVTRLYGTLDALHKSVAEAFPYSYASMTNVAVAEGITSISADMFAGCVSLKNVELPDSLCEIEKDAFNGCANFEWQIVDGYKFCDGWLFGYESDAAEEVPGINSIRGIANGALEDCQSIKRVIFDEITNFRNIGACTFKNCAALSEVQLPLAITNIADEAFLNCAALKAFIVPGNVKRIGDRAFKTCSSMERAMLEYGIESIGEEAFYDCWRISEVDIPSTVTDVGDNAFGGDSSIIRIGIRPDIKPIKKMFSNYEYIREAVVKASDTAIDGCFEGCKQLNAVRFLGDCPQMEDGGENFYADTDVSIHKNDDGSAVTNVNNLVTYVGATSIGWNTPGSQARADVALPQAWPWTGKHRKPISIWDLPTYLCQFDSNGGTLGVQDTYQYSEQKFALPPEPVQSGYKFAGWWTQPVGGLRVTADTIFIEGVYTKLFAHWIKGHWVFLDPNGGEVVNDFVTYMEETTYGVLPTPVRSGYAFGGWLYNGQLITPETAIMEATDHTIVAQWTANLYSVRYHANGGSGDMNDDGYVYGVAKALRKNAFVRSGYVFAGWATELGGAVKYKDGESVANLTATANGYVDLYAVWEVNDVDEPSNIELFFGGDASWIKLSQGVDVSSGDAAGKYDTVWQSGEIEDNQVSLMKATVNGRGTIGFWWKASCEQFRNLKLDYLEFSVDGTAREPWINGETEWAYVEFEIEETGMHELCWTYAKDEEGSDYDDCGMVTGIRWTPKMSTIAEFVNCDNLTFTTSGDAEWIGDFACSHDGVASLRSGDISDGEETRVETEIEGNGRLSFYWRVSSEAFRNYQVDYVAFLVDGEEIDWIGGDVDWKNVDYEVTDSKKHVFTWVYRKDAESGTADGDDCAWIDEVKWEPKATSGTIIADVTALKEAFGEESSVVRNLTSEEELVKFNEFLGKCGIMTASQISDRQKQYAYESFRMSAITVEPRLFENDPKLKIHEFKQGEGGWSVSISLKAGGEEIAMARKALEEHISVGNKLTEITAKPDIVASPSEDGASLTFTIAPPEGKQAFIMVRL